MADDLNEFLRQAAARREARKRSGQQPASPIPQNPTSRPASPPPVSRPTQTPPAARSASTFQTREVIHAELKSSLPTESGIAKADRQRAAHAQEMFGKKNNQGAQQKPNAKPSNTPKKVDSKKNAASAPSVQAGVPTTFGPISESSGPLNSNELLRMLRDPRSLRNAFIVSEIFQRKFD